MRADLNGKFVVRPPAMDDLDDVAAMINACARADIGAEDFSPVRLRTIWTLDDFDPAADAWVVTARDRPIVAYAHIEEEDPPSPYSVSGWVHPDYRGRGIGTHLLRRVEARGRERMSHAAPDLWAGLLAGTYATNTGARRLLENEGYHHARSWLRMRIEMDAPPPAPRPLDGITLRTFRAGQEDHAMHQAYEEAMADEWDHPALAYAEWRHYKIDSRPDFDAALWFLALEGDRIAGFALCRWERPGQPDEGHVTDLGVRPAWRRRGIGLALLQHAFGEFYRRGKRRVGLGVDATSLTGADHLYRKAGMHVLLETALYEKELRPGKRAT